MNREKAEFIAEDVRRCFPEVTVSVGLRWFTSGFWVEVTSKDGKFTIFGESDWLVMQNAFTALFQWSRNETPTS